MANYTTLSDVKQQIPESGLNGTTDYDAQLETLITTASRLIDGYLGVPANYFAASSDGETRYYNGTNDYEIMIDDVTSVTALAVSLDGGLASSDYTAYSSSDYFLEPYNAALNGEPYNRLCIDILNSTVDPFPAYRKAVKVTGVFGYSTTAPDLVAQACKTQVIQWYMRAKSAWQNTGANEAMLVDTGGKLSEDVKAMLHSFMMRRL